MVRLLANQTRKPKDEETTTEHCGGRGCSVCVGPGLGNNDLNNHDDGRRRNNHRVYTRQRRRYRFGKTVTYVTKSGKVLDEDTVKTRIRVGVPVHVHYVGTGDEMTVDRVILDED